jgi:hypothetical protein
VAVKIRAPLRSFAFCIIRKSELHGEGYGEDDKRMIAFATYGDGVLVWNLIEISASGTAAIEFSALVPGDGRFTNIVEVGLKTLRLWAWFRAAQVIYN